MYSELKKIAGNADEVIFYNLLENYGSLLKFEATLVFCLFNLSFMYQ